MNQTHLSRSIRINLLFIVLLWGSVVFGKEPEVHIGRDDRAAIDARIHETIETAGVLLDEAQLSQHISDILIRLIGIQPGTAPPYRIRIINSSELNAFSLSDGTVYISLGIFGMIDNDAQLAMLIAHEIAHVKSDHHRLIRYEMHKRSSSTLWGFNSRYNLRVALSGFSKSQERQADSLAVEMIIQSGYNAWEAKNFFITMYNWLKYKEKSYNEKFATHPKISSRYHAVKKHLQNIGYDSTSGITGEDTYHAAVASCQQQIIDLLIQSNCVNELYAMALSRLNNEQPFAEWFYLRGSLLEKYYPVDSFPVAHYSLTTALAKRPSLTESFRELGWLFLKNDKPDSARTYLSQYLMHTPTAPDTALILYYLDLLNE